MNTHSIDLIRYCARSRGNSTIYLGTAGSHGNEQLQVTLGKGWEGLTVQVVFHPCKVAVQLPANGVLDVPWEATARPLTALQGRIVFQGFDQDRLVNSTDLAYTVASHSPALGRDEQPYTPGIVEGVLNQMAADKDAILQAAQQTGQAKEAAAASAAEAASSAANAQQSAGAANTSAGQAAASASQAAGSAAAANETLTQVQTAGQEAQQKVKDAETEALGNIAAAAPALPAVSAAAAWQSVTAKPDGTGYNLAAMAPIEATIRPTVTGNPAVCEDSVAWGLQGLKIYGKSIQDGTPSPENPVPIVSAGDNGNIDISINGLQFIKFPFKSSNGFLQNGVRFSYDDSQVIHVKRESDGAGTAFFDLCIIEKLFERQVMIDYPDLFYSDKKSTFSYSVDAELESGAIGIQYNTANSVLSLNVRTNFSGECNIKVMLNFGAKSLPWEPYKSQILTLSTPNGLPGIPVEYGGNFTDVDGQQLVCNVKDYGAGKYTQNCAKIVLSSEMEWQLSVSGYWFYTVIEGAARKGKSPVLCNYFKAAAKGWGVNPETENTICLGNDVSGVLGISTTKFGTVDALKEWLTENTVEVLYPLESPIETDIPAEELAAYRALTTYDGTTVVSTTEPVAGIEASYVMDGNKYRESVDKRLAALEAAQTGI